MDEKSYWKNEYRKCKIALQIYQTTALMFNESPQSEFVWRMTQRMNKAYMKSRGM